MFKYAQICTAAAVCAALLASCKTAPYEVVQKGEYQIAGHPYKTAEDCERKAPVGKFDGECDIPVVGWRGAEGMQAIVPQAGGGWPSSGSW